MTIKAARFVTGASGLELTADERRFIAESRPFGLIVFRRNVESRDQLRALCDEFRSLVGWHAPVLVDQEGGRVQRLGPPTWAKMPSASRLADAATSCGDDLLRIAGRLLAADLLDAGINVDCAPCLDLAIPGQSNVIGDRSYGADPDRVASLAGSLAQGLLDGGVLPVIKHIPGHGRALVDSHEKLPVVDTDLATLRSSDFRPFKALAHLPAGMTAHVVYTAIDPDRPATTSETMIRDIIRGEIGFDGLLFSDDVSMGALDGSLGDRSRRTLDAGCDLVLHCNGDLAEMQAVAEAAPMLSGPSLKRAEAALAHLTPADAADLPDLRARLAEVMSAAEGQAGV
ncbi:Beta-hexosaminidase [Hartmannibacter diazotrophicus]|uniref:beta-N-acetylhexosaminidase n=1 Tax=Hartmannibacter diazotrophicus TaxID=1482074 RepID=A0A2C9D6Z5_9HYPH|nr:beta-N-acetylhexosaminidase [Hartmannibacter diazotrophicus]SON55949.1 Beta-hexosaminidase [Hartmannibacter diazotrophicus]